MEVDITQGSITVRLGGVESYCTDSTGAMVHPDSPSGVQIISYTFSRAGVSWQAVNPVPVNDNVPYTSLVPTGTFLQEKDSLVVGFTWSTRPSPTPYSANDEIFALVVVPYGSLDNSQASTRLRPTAIGNPSNSVVNTIRSTELLFDNATIDALPSVIDLDTIAAHLPSGVWGTFGNSRPDIDDYITWFSRFCGELWTGWGSASYTPSQQHPGYGAAMASMTGEGLMLAVSTEDAAKRRELARRMSQWGIDLMGAFASGRADRADGGHYQGRKALIVLALHLLESAFDATTLFPGQFNEDLQFPTGSPAWVWGWPYGYVGKTEQPCNLSDPIASWNASAVYYLPQYFQQEVCGTQVGCAVAMNILGLREKMGAAHYGMMAQFMEGPTAENQALMTARSASLGTIHWGKTYSLAGSHGSGGPWNMGDAAWTEYGDYEAAPGSPEISVSGDYGNSSGIVDGDTVPREGNGTDFGTTAEGGSTISRTFNVANVGSAALTISGATVPTGFTVTTALPASIAAGGTAPLTVRLDVASAGTKSGNVTITSNDADEGTFTFAIQGIVGAAQAPNTRPPSQGFFLLGV